VKRRVLASVSIILLTAAVLAAQQTTTTTANRNTNVFTITGKIVVPDAHFEDLFEVLLVQNLEQVVQATVANNQGQYKFVNIQRGTYYILVKLEGYEEVRHRVDLNTAADTIQNIIMDFKEERIIKPPMDFSGEDLEVVDLSELERNFPSKLTNEVKNADKEIHEGEYQKALIRLESVVREAPDLYVAHRLLGIAYQKLNRIRDAESEFKTAADLKPASAAPLVNLGSLYLQEAEASAAKGSGVVRTILNEALRNLNAAVKIKNDAAFAYYLLGVTYYRSAFYEEAEDQLRHAMELAPALFHARLALANVYIRMQEWPNAIAQLDAYLASNPKADSRAEVEAMRTRVIQRSQAKTR
jgi:tetratricopeptide (TPR) repeat protein